MGHQAGHVVIVAAPGDRAQSEQIARLVRKAGWSVRNLWLGDMGGPVHDASLDIGTAHAVVLIWSAQAGPGIASADQAVLDAAGSRLVLVRIDAAAPPLSGQQTIDLSEAADIGGAPAEALLRPILGARPSALPVEGAREAAPAAETSPRPRRRLVPWLLGLSGIGAVLAGAVAMLATYPSTPAPIAPAPDAGPVIAHAAPLESAGTTGQEAGVDWREAAQRGPAAIRAFLARVGEGAEADEARALLIELDAQAWSDVAGTSHVSETLDRLRAYRALFPDGAFLAEADQRENRERARILDVRTRLAQRGLPGGTDGGFDPELIAAIRSFQREVGLPPTGQIDDALEKALADQAMATPADRQDVSPPALAQAVHPPGTVFRDCYVCPEMIALPPGDFVMGDTTGRAPSDERPSRTVTIAYRLAVGRHEVTFEDWRACVADAACRPLDTSADGRMPAGGVAPGDIDAFLAWLNRRTGAGYRLLSEAEWEYAARAGSPDAWISGNLAGSICAFGNGADRSSSYAWRNAACSDDHAGPAAAGTFRANAFGLHDMMGNLWEWTADCWHASYEGAPGDGSAWTEDCDSAERVLRGGSYSVEIDKLRVSFRYRFAARAMPFFGFRVARLLD